MATLTIAIGDTESNVLDDPKSLFDNMLFFAPAAIGGVTTVEVSPKRAANTLAADWKTLQSGGSDVALTAGKATPVTLSNAAALRVVTDTTVAGADEVYEVIGDQIGR